MNYTIKLSENGRFLIVKAKGDINADIIRQWSKDLGIRSRAMDIRKFLFDVRAAQNTNSVLQDYTFAYHDSEELNMQRNARSAILVDLMDRSHDFVETTLKNAGYIVRIFTDESSAEKWLDGEGS